jgi:hypothetical protein
MPLIMCADSIDGADELMAWRKTPGNKGILVAGDDRTPAWTWQTRVYSDGEHVAIPAENIMVALRQGGAQMTLKGKKTFKEVSQSGLIVDGEFCEFLCGDKKIQVSDIIAVKQRSFTEQSQFVKDRGFELFSKRVRVGNAKHIRVRPRFRSWSVSGVIYILKQEITFDVLTTMFELAGRCGLGDWRPSSRTPGCYGQFETTLTQL